MSLEHAILGFLHCQPLSSYVGPDGCPSDQTGASVPAKISQARTVLADRLRMI